MPPKFYSFVLPPLVVIHCFKLLSYAIWEKTNEPNLILTSLTQFWVTKNGEKPHFGPDLRPLGPNSGHQFFFFFFFRKIWLSQSIDFMGNYHYVQYQKKLMIQSWEKFSEGRKDRQTGRRTDGREWFYRTLSDVEHPKIVLLFFMIWFDRMIWAYIEKWKKC